MTRLVDRGPAEGTHPPGVRLRYLDGWRALAIGGVLVGHFVSSYGLNAGRLGVELFFVLSGRLMAQILFFERSPLPQFFYRRFTRVWPAMFVFVLIMGAITPLLRTGGLTWTEAITSLTYTYNYAAIVWGRGVFTDHIWSLCIEEHTYLYLGIIAVLSRRFGLAVVPILLATIALNQVSGWASTWIWQQDYYHTYWRTDVRMSSILFGAVAFLTRDRWPSHLSGWVPVVLFAVGVMLNLNRVPDPIKYSLGTMCLALAIANLDRAVPAVTRALSRPPVAWFGVVSYSVYLWQQPFISLYRGAVPIQLLCMAAAVAVGLLSYYFVENPLRLRLNLHPPRWAARGAPRR